ncbi:MAG: metal-sulfur cluster assembly factor [Methylotenera sp.]|nr:metal-sulfur cluster assembly factor [Methylotenera sp.]
MKTCNESLPQREQSVRDALLQVIDPEVGENIVDLGLVYGIGVSEDVVIVTFTMTSQACPMGEMLLDDIHATLTRLLPSEVNFNMNLVWEPPWNPDMMSTEAKQRLGWS